MHTSSSNLPLMAIAALATALFWGVYGPLLTWGHQTMVVMEGDKAVSYGRLRPFICVGVAYLLVAVIGPALLIGSGLMEKGEGLLSGWSMTGIWWSLIAGAAGAMGALFLLVALNYAPLRPSPALYVMPLVFGCAPVINTLFTMWHKRAWNLNPFFLAGLILVVVGSVTVLATAQLNVGSKEASRVLPPSKPDENEPAPGGYSLDEPLTDKPQG